MPSSRVRSDDHAAGTARVASTDASTPASAVELLILLSAGAAASLAVNLLRFRLGIPGSSIVLASIPLALGTALVPRRGAGALMAGGAIGTNVLLALAGVRLDGIGAQTSLVLTGPLLELARSIGLRGWRLHLAFIGACTASSAAAFLVRSVARAYGMRGTGGGGGRGLFAGWFPNALWTYALCGIVAGLVCAGAWSQLRGRARP